MQSSRLTSESEFSSSIQNADQINSRSEAQKERVQTACTYCRYRKVKCDGGRPSCSFCTHMGRQGECVYAKVSEEENESLRKRKRELRARRAAENRRQSITQDDVQRERSSSTASQSLQQQLVSYPYPSTSPSGTEKRRKPRPRAQSGSTTKRSQSSTDQIDPTRSSSASTNSYSVDRSSVSSSLDASHLSGLPAELSNTITPNFFSIFHQRNANEMQTSSGSSNISIDGSPASNTISNNHPGNQAPRLLGRHSSLSALVPTNEMASGTGRPSSIWSFHDMSDGQMAARLQDSPLQMQQQQADVLPSNSYADSSVAPPLASNSMHLLSSHSRPPASTFPQQQQQQAGMVSSNPLLGAFHPGARNVSAMNTGSMSANSFSASPSVDPSVPDFFAAMQASMASTSSQPAHAQSIANRMTAGVANSVPIPQHDMRTENHSSNMADWQTWNSNPDIRPPTFTGIGAGGQSFPMMSQSQPSYHPPPVVQRRATDSMRVETPMLMDQSAAASSEQQPSHVDSMSQIRSFITSEQFPLQNATFAPLAMSGQSIRRSSPGQSSANTADQSDAKQSYPAYYINPP